MTTSRGQTTVRDAHRVLRLPGCGILSPYQVGRFRTSSLQTEAFSRRIETGRDIKLSLKNMLTLYVCGYRSESPTTVAVDVDVVSDTISTFGNGTFSIPVTVSSTPADIESQSVSVVQTYCTGIGYPAFDRVVWVCPKPTSINVARTFSNPSLAVNTARQASTTSDALVIASVEIGASLSLSGGAKGTVSLQYADNNTFTTNLKTASVGVNGNTGTLTVGLNTTQAGSGVVAGIIPAGKYYRLLTTNVTGTPTFGTPVIQEVLL